MRNSIIKRQKVRIKREQSVRKKLHGTASRPRMSVIKTNKHIHVQLIDDDNSETLGATATFSKEFKSTEFSKKSIESAKKLGQRISEIAKDKNITEVIFDRGRFKYHGILAELANSARAGGLKF